jgi:toxin-antitoxin system PIN domain toxin
LVDANVLLYADNEAARDHDLALEWLEDALGRSETLLIPWVSLLAFLRISTHSGIQDRPHTVASAMRFLRAVTDSPRVIAGAPDGRHWERVETLLEATGVGGNLVNDAHLAALAVQYDATVVSFDNDFTRFPEVRWERPAAPTAPEGARS